MQAVKLMPVREELVADEETPVSIFKKLRCGAGSFLLESVEGGEHLARYSFLGFNPLWTLESKGNMVKGGPFSRTYRGDPFKILKEIMSSINLTEELDLGRFAGGVIGYFGYDLSRRFLRRPSSLAEHFLPDIYLVFPKTVLIFDHVKNVIEIIVFEEVFYDEKASHQRALKTINEIKEKIKSSKETFPAAEKKQKEMKDFNFLAETPQDEFLANVKKAKEYIEEGEAIQVVLSRQWQIELKEHPFSVYRALRRINPSPYMFYLELSEGALLGSSPEMQIRVENGLAEINPIAGTRARGQTLKEDQRLEEELKKDEKENAEHLMLVDLARNDLGVVCQAGSVEVKELAVIEKYSHVMHLVSKIEGKLAHGKDALDALLASFPAGTVSGAPKIRALEIIDELEKVPRGPYGGAVGYLSLNGNLDTCLTIRSLLVKKNRAYVQAGAGIVADSEPQKELEETLNKAKSVLSAIAISQGAENLDFAHR